MLPYFGVSKKIITSVARRQLEAVVLELLPARTDVKNHFLQARILDIESFDWAFLTGELDVHLVLANYNVVFQQSLRRLLFVKDLQFAVQVTGLDVRLLAK